MNRRVSRRTFMRTSAAALSAGAAFWRGGNDASAADMQPIRLPQSSDTGGNTLMDILRKRRPVREFRPAPLPIAVLSRLLWAAFGINRPDGKRTAPSARNRQEIDIYAATSDGLYLYHPKDNVLIPILTKDIRHLTGTQSYVRQAPVNLVYVADVSKMGVLTDEEKVFYAAADTGFICQNVYLYCAAEGLGTTVRAAIDKPLLAAAMNLRPDQMITLAQTVGYPK